MAKVKRQIITIDEEKCDGCGNCVPACVEGALQVIDGKARLVKQSYCDGLGACLGDCPQDALHVTTLEVEAYDEPAVLGYLQQTAPEAVERHVEHLRAHGMQSSYTPRGQSAAGRHPALPFGADAGVGRRTNDEGRTGGRAASSRSCASGPCSFTWCPRRRPSIRADLTLIADCVPFANPNMHADLLRDSAIAVGCPKLDDGQAYINKVTQILQSNDIRSLKVAYMEVPCCRGLVFIAQQALALSGKDIPFETEIVSIQ